jgi:hypothetical protein
VTFSGNWQLVSGDLGYDTGGFIMALIGLYEVSLSFGDPLIFDDLSLEIGTGERL